jgi:hypothetical protein
MRPASKQARSKKHTVRTQKVRLLGLGSTLDGEGRSQAVYLRSRSLELREMAKTTDNHDEMRVCGRLEMA